MAIKSFLEEHFPVTVLEPDADRYNADPATDVVSFSKFRTWTFIIMEGAGGTGTTTVTLEECDDVVPTTTNAIAFTYQVASTHGVWGAPTAATAAGYATVAGANKSIAITVDADELADGSPYARLQTTELVDGAVDASIVAIGSNPRYAQAVMENPLV